jgi:hypothetical protein
MTFLTMRTAGGMGHDTDDGDRRDHEQQDSAR